MGSLLGIVIAVTLVVLIPGIPAYVIAQRRGLKNPAVAFVPLVGCWIILFESTGQRGWLGLIMLFPLLGLMLAFTVPHTHGRSQWWSAALLVPGLNLVGYWFYAFTFPRVPAARLAGALN